MAGGKRRADPAAQRAEEEFQTGLRALVRHPLFTPLICELKVARSATCPHDGWLVCRQSGSLHCHPTRHATATEWEFVLACGALHYALGHFREHEDPIRWQAAAELAAARFVREVGVGKPPEGHAYPPAPPGRDAQAIERRLPPGRGRPLGFPPALSGSGPGLLLDGPARLWLFGRPTDWETLFARGLREAVTRAVEVAGGLRRTLVDRPPPDSIFVQARDWFVSSYPLLGALARHFEIVDDPELCDRLQVSIAAVDETAEEIYVHRGAGLGLEEARFVLAHELLHVGLRHLDRRAGRRPFLWNVACDFVINGWLVEMRVGAPPSGILYDPAFAGQSAESVYDLLNANPRACRRLSTLRGRGLGDVLERGDRPPKRGGSIDLDEFYRSCLGRGLELHRSSGRGLLPAGLVEEILALQQPPIPWDVRLAQCFEDWFPPAEARRTYARPSRRQAATPDIPRPRYHLPEELARARTFGVVLDTSGSMEAELLAKALGAIASYAARHEVSAARVVFCDAAPYDAGYVAPAEIAGRVQVRGRGGTLLQPGIELLQRADDFPPDGPILVITDGACDVLRVQRPHAFLLPKGRRLPFGTQAPVFFLE